MYAWRKAMDVNRNGRVGEAEFAQICKRLGYLGDPKRLFRAILPEKEKDFLSLGDVFPQTMNKMYRGDLSVLAHACDQPVHVSHATECAAVSGG